MHVMAPNIPESVFMAFQMTFAIITARCLRFARLCVARSLLDCSAPPLRTPR